jgi:hypothetical protein
MASYEDKKLASDPTPERWLREAVKEMSQDIASDLPGSVVDGHSVTEPIDIPEFELPDDSASLVETMQEAADTSMDEVDIPAEPLEGEPLGVDIDQMMDNASREIVDRRAGDNALEDAMRAAQGGIDGLGDTISDVSIGLDTPQDIITDNYLGQLEVLSDSMGQAADATGDIIEKMVQKLQVLEHRLRNAENRLDRMLS